MKNIVIFGATSTIATACARIWVTKGCNLFLVGRDKTKLVDLVADLRVRGDQSQIIDYVCADLCELDKHEQLYELARQCLSVIDMMLVFHGTLSDQKNCESSVSKTLEEINVNALSYISLLTIAANYMEEQSRGVIIAVSSVAGDRGRQSNYIYGSAKGMVSLFMQGLRNRLAKKNVTVITVKPGFVDTPMTAQFEKKGFLWAQPEDIAMGIVQAADNKRDVVYLPGKWRWIMLIIKLIPENIFKRLSL